MERRERAQEASLPVQSRVNIIELANIDKYFLTNGYKVRTMSQLISWSVGLLTEILTNNGNVNEIDTVEEANKYLEFRGLHQPSMKKKGLKKLSHALAFESLRLEGTNPKQYVPRQHQVLHNKNSVQPFAGQIVGECKYSDVIDDAYARIREEEEKERKALTEKAIENAKAGGILADEDEYTQQRLAKQRKMFEERQAAIEAKKKALEEGKKDEPVKSVKEGMSEEEFYADAAERDRKLQEEEDKAMEEFMTNQKNVIGDESS